MSMDAVFSAPYGLKSPRRPDRLAHSATGTGRESSRTRFGEPRGPRRVHTLELFTPAVWESTPGKLPYPVRKTDTLLIARVWDLGSNSGRECLRGAGVWRPLGGRIRSN